MRSDVVKKGVPAAPNRSLLYALGYTKEELERPLIGQLRQRLLELGALGARMTGSGSAVYGIFAQEGAAERARQAMAQQPVQAWLARPIG